MPRIRVIEQPCERDVRACEDAIADGPVERLYDLLSPRAREFLDPVIREAAYNLYQAEAEYRLRGFHPYTKENR